MRNKVVKTITILLTIIALTMSNFVSVGIGLISYAQDDTSTNNKNVEFSAYFKDENGNETLSKNITAEGKEERLFIKIKANNDGYVSGKIKLNNSNFKFKEATNQVVANLGANSITLNEIVDTVELEIKIEFTKTQNNVSNIVNQESIVEFEGIYQDANKKQTQVNAKKAVTLNLKSNITEEKIENGVQILTNKILKIDGEEKRVLQIGITSGIKDNSYPIKNISLEVNVPKIEGQEPIIRKQEKLTNMSKCEYEIKDENIKINMENEEGKWIESNEEIILTYIYPKEIDLSNIQIQVSQVLTMYDNVDVNATAIAEIEECDNIISASTTNEESEIFKGKINSGLERAFNTTTNIEFRLIGAVENVTIKDKSSFGTEEKLLGGNICYEKTAVNKQNLIDILGQTGEIIIYNENTQELARINATSQEDENGNVIINYGEAQPKELIIKTTAPQTLGKLEIKNTKVIKQTSKNIVRNANRIYNIITQNYNEHNTEQFTKGEQNQKNNYINLQDSSTQANIEISNSNLSTLRQNENVQLLLTLKNNNETQDLYKNPKIDIILPKDIKLDVKKVEQLNGENEIKITRIGKRQLEDGKTNIHIEMEGEQKDFSNQISGGMQIAIIGEITIENTVPSKQETIQMLYTNENREGAQFETNIPIEITSKYGVLMINKLENYNNLGETQELTDNKTATASLDSNAQAKLATQTINIINNYEEPITNVSIVGTLENEKDLKEIEANLQNINLTNDKNAVIYYTNEGTKWTQNKDELEKVEAFKIELQDEVLPKENLNVAYNLYIPENIEQGQALNTKATLQYQYKDKDETTVSEISLSTKQARASANETNVETQNIEGLEVSVVAETGATILKENDEVKEGQGIKYKLKVTNKTNEKIENIKLQATNTNAIYYNNISYDYDMYGETIEKVKYVEDETLTSKELQIQELNAGETKELEYQISVKEVTDENQTTSGTIKVLIGNEEKETINTVTNKIKQGDLKLNLLCYTQENQNLYIGEGLQLQLKVTNTSNKELKDIIVELPIDQENTEFSTEEIAFEDLENGEFIEYKDNVAKFKIPKLSSGEDTSINVQLLTKSPKVTKEDIIITEYFGANVQDEKYISNQYSKVFIQDQTEVKAVQTTNIQGDTVKNGDNIKFTIDVKTTGLVKKTITVADVLDIGLEINSIKLIHNGKEQILKNDRIFVTSIEIEPEDEFQIIIDTTLNSNLVNGNKIKSILDISGYSLIVEKNDIELKIEEKQNNTPDNPNNPDDPDDPNNEKTNDIKGTVWVDSNKNGHREETEEKLANIEVILLDEEKQEIAKDENGKEITTKTDSDGAYKFEKLVKGNYSVVFIYDNKKYTLTDYQKEGVDVSTNSDVLNATIKLQNQELKCAKTKVLVLNGENLSSIDAGLIEAQIFDLRLNKYIDRIVAQNSKGTKVFTYNKEQLAKAELEAKQLANTNVTIEYTIEITNEGEVPGYASEIVDYMPNGLDFSSSENPKWTKNNDGNLYTTELSNEIIMPGETKSVKLTLSKVMTQDNTGTVINKAEISKHYNEYAIEDIDSTPGNKQDGEDDISTVNVILSIRTGRAILYTTGIISAIAILAVGIYFIKKKVIGR